MTFPTFFNQAPTIQLRDPLAQFLGATASGIIAYRYEDAVKLCGHSCPTVASAYLMTIRGIQALYGDEMPERGNISVQIRGERNQGTTGVTASVATLLTGQPIWALAALAQQPVLHGAIYCSLPQICRAKSCYADKTQAQA